MNNLNFDSCLNEVEQQQLKDMITEHGGRVTLGEYDEFKGVEVVVVRDLTRKSVQKIAELVCLEKLNGVFVN